MDGVELRGRGAFLNYHDKLSWLQTFSLETSSLSLTCLMQGNLFERLYIIRLLSEKKKEDVMKLNSYVGASKKLYCFV